MYRTSNRISLPALAVAAALAFVVTGGTAGLFALSTGTVDVDAGTFVTAKAGAEALPMREIVPNRVEVIGVREVERVSAASPAAPRRERT